MTDTTMIPREVLGEQWFSFRHKVLEGLQSAFRVCGLTKDQIAKRLGKDAATINRCLRGQQNMTLRTMHDLARAMGFRLRVEFDELSALPPSNRGAALAREPWKPTPAISGPSDGQHYQVSVG